MCPHDLLSVERVVPTLAATDKDDVLVALASRIASTHPAIDADAMLDVLRRYAERARPAA